MATNDSLNNPLDGSEGTGKYVGDQSPTLTTPNIGAASGTSLNLGSSTTITGMIDDDSFSTASSSTAASSESIKAYVDASTGGGGGFTWNYVSGTSSATTAANGYITDNASTVTLTLPATIARGQGVAVQNIGAGVVRIAQNASQYIKFGASTSTVGVGGYVEVTVPVNGFILLCTEANVGFCFLTPPTGALTVV